MSAVDGRARGGRSRWLGPALLALLAGWLLAPLPDRGLLQRSLPELEGRTPWLMGSVVAIFLDPSFYYRFAASDANVAALVAAVPLERREPGSFDARAFERSGPLPWHRWWWRPGSVAHPQFYVGNRNGNIIYLLFDPEQGRVFLYVQNT